MAVSSEMTEKETQEQRRPHEDEAEITLMKPEATTTKDCVQVPGARERQKGFSPTIPGREQVHTHTPTSNCSHPELGVNTFLVLEATKFVAVCSGNWRKWIQHLTVNHGKIPTLTIVFFFSNPKSSISWGVGQLMRGWESGITVAVWVCWCQTLGSSIFHTSAYSPAKETEKVSKLHKLLWTLSS